MLSSNSPMILSSLSVLVWRRYWSRPSSFRHVRMIYASPPAMTKNGQIFVVPEIVRERQNLRSGPRFPLPRALAVHHRDVSQRVLRLLDRSLARNELAHRETRLLHVVQRTRLLLVQKRVVHVPVHRKFHVYHRRRVRGIAPAPSEPAGIAGVAGLPRLPCFSGFSGFGGEKSVEAGFGLQFRADLAP